MFNEYEAFKQTEVNMSAKISELSKELKQTKSEHAKAIEAYRKMMVDNASGTGKQDTSELIAAKKKVDELAVTTEVAQERLQMVSDGKLNQLKALMGDVKNGWQREVNKLNAEVLQIFASAREHRAKLTLEIQKGHEKYLKAQKLLQALNQAERMVGINYIEHTTRMGVPEKPLIKEYQSSDGIGYRVLTTDKCVLPSEEELEKAYQRGELSDWVKHYADTGELVTDLELRIKAANPTPMPTRGANNLLGRVLGR